MKTKSVALLLAMAVGCASAAKDERSADGVQARGNAPQTDPTSAGGTAPASPAILPAAGGQFAHTQFRVVKGDRKDAGARVADVEACAQCHADVASQWRTSAHAFASFNNPVYRTSVLKFRAEVGNAKSQFCGGCHDVSLLVDNAMTQEIDPNDPRAHAGITCNTCHGVANARPDGNASYDLDVSEVPIPKDGDSDSVLRHRARVAATPLRTASLCISCHRAFLNDDSGNMARHLIGQDDATPWARSVYAGSQGARVDQVTDEKDCRGCHMPKEAATQGDPAAKQGSITSHRFLGAHTWLAAMRGDAQQQSKVEQLLKSAASVDVAAVIRADGKRNYADVSTIDVAAGEHLDFDVVVKNELVGHRFPGGVMDAADTWLDVRVTDADGTVLADAGTTHDKDPNDGAHTFSSYMADGDGKRLLGRETHGFKANVYNATIPPRDAVVVRYGFDVPARMPKLPLSVSVKLRHRPRSLNLQELACKEYRTDRGHAYAKGGLKNVAKNLDPCRAQPIVDLAEAELRIGSGPASAARGFDRDFAHGQGLLRSLQEHAWEAREPFERALAEAKAPRERAMAMGALAQLAAREGAKDLTFEWATKAEALVPGHPALARARAQVLMSQWKWSEAADQYRLAASASPRDDGLFGELAIALGGSGRAREALEATRPGLLLQPRDWDLLRVQALSLEAMGRDAEAAKDAFLAVRPPDDAPGVRGKCSKNVVGCANERNPVHTHPLRPRR